MHGTNMKIFTSLRFSALHFASVHFTTLHFASVHFTTLHFASVHFTTLHSPFFTSVHSWTSRHHASQTIHFSLIITFLLLRGIAMIVFYAYERVWRRVVWPSPLKWNGVISYASWVKLLTVSSARIFYTVVLCCRWQSEMECIARVWRIALMLYTKLPFIWFKLFFIYFWNGSIIGFGYWYSLLCCMQKPWIGWKVLRAAFTGSYFIIWIPSIFSHPLWSFMKPCCLSV